jgi:dTDP-4-amino-4,6-dideoxygalactose transaminase
MLDIDNRPGIISICKKHGLKILEDAAHAFPTRHAGRMIGSLGDATCFSFYANKTITTGEGGMLTTNDPKIAERVRIMRLHGINRDIWNRYTDSKPNWEYDVVAPGYKYNLSDVNAAIGLAQLERAEEMREARQKVAKFYLDRLSDLECIQFPGMVAPDKDHAWHLFCMVLKPQARLSRDKFIGKMAEAGIGTSVHYKPLHRMTYYRERYGLTPDDFPNSEKIWRGTVSLPIYPNLKKDELEYITSTIRSLLC